MAVNTCIDAWSDGAVLAQSLRLPIFGVMAKAILNEAEISAIIEMALSDHTSFAQIEREYGLSDAEVKTLMRSNLKPSSYRTWRKRVRAFGDRREHYK